MSAAASRASCPIIIKVPVHGNKPRGSAPPVAARLQARGFPTRAGSSPEKQARKELLVASQKARKSATAAAHNAKVTDVRDTATLMKRQIETYQRSTIDRRLQEAEALRAARLEARANKAKQFVARVDSVSERNEERKTQLAEQTARKLEAATHNRLRKLSAIAFRAADASARAKSLRAKSAAATEAASARAARKLFVASHRRERQLELVAGKAAFFNIRAERNAASARLSQAVDQRAVVARLASKMAAAEYLRGVDVRLRRQKAQLANERAAHVLERRRLSETIDPVLGAARIKTEQQLAKERREGFVRDVARRAHGFVRRVVMTCAANEVRERRVSELGRAALEARLAGAELRAHEAKQARKTKSRRMSERMSESELELERSPNPVPAARQMLKPRPATSRGFRRRASDVGTQFPAPSSWPTSPVSA